VYITVVRLPVTDQKQRLINLDSELVEKENEYLATYYARSIWSRANIVDELSIGNLVGTILSRSN
jgi:hypothetical protein